MNSTNLSTLDRIQLEIKESIKREKELRNGYSNTQSDSSDNCDSINSISTFPSNPPLPKLNNKGSSNEFTKFTQNTSRTKGVMHKFLKSRGRLSMSAINREKNQNNWTSDAAFTPAKIIIEKGSKPLRNGFVSTEEKMKKELQEFQQRETQLREERRKSQPNLMAALQFEEENELDDFDNNLNGLLKSTKSMANLHNNSDDGFEDVSSSTGGSLKPARSLADLCDLSDDEGALPGTHSLIHRFENMQFKNGSSKTPAF